MVDASGVSGVPTDPVAVVDVEDVRGYVTNIEIQIYLTNQKCVSP